MRGGRIEAHFYRVIGIDQGLSVPTGALLRADKVHGRHLTPLPSNRFPFLAH